MTQHLTDHLMRFTQHAQRALDQAFTPYPISPAQYKLMSLVEHGDRLTQKQLAATLQSTEANVSQLLTRLTTSKLLKKTRHGRHKHLHLTESGQALLETLHPIYQQWNERCCAALTDAERQIMLMLLEKMTLKMSQETTPGTISLLKQQDALER